MYKNTGPCCSCTRIRCPGCTSRPCRCSHRRNSREPVPDRRPSRKAAQDGIPRPRSTARRIAPCCPCSRTRRPSRTYRPYTRSRRRSPPSCRSCKPRPGSTRSRCTHPRRRRGPSSDRTRSRKRDRTSRRCRRSHRRNPRERSRIHQVHIRRSYTGSGRYSRRGCARSRLKHTHRWYTGRCHRSPRVCSRSCRWSGRTSPQCTDCHHRSHLS